MTTKESTGPVRFSLSYKVIWGVAELGKSLIAGAYGALLLIFYQDYLGLTAKWIYLASLIFAIWNAVNDPLFGYITDSTRSKMGRRIPYMRFTAPFLALTFVLLWLAPPGAGEITLFIWMLVVMLLYDTCYTIVGLVYAALLPEVTESDAERNWLQISASLFGLLGSLLGFLIPDFFRPKAGAALAFQPLQTAMLVMAVFAMLLIIATTLKVKERKEFTQVDRPLPLWPSIRYSVASKAFRSLVPANFMTVLMLALVQWAMYYLADYVLRIDFKVLAGALFAPLIIGIPLTTVFRRRFGVVSAEQLLLVIAGVGFVLVTVVPPAFVLPCLVLAGFGVSGPQTLTNLLLAQVVDEDELRSGVRREGAFLGINALFTKPAQSAALALTPYILTQAHFITRASNEGQAFLEQPASAILGIRLIAGLIPGIAMFAGAFLLQFYPLRGKYLAKVQKEVLELHAKKHAALEERTVG